jgi:hypothetical protein
MNHAASRGIRSGPRRAILGSLVALGLAAPAAAQDIEFGGYVRAYAGWNLDDPVEVPGNDKWRNNMLRGQLYLEASSANPTLQWKLSGRLARERKTGYLSDLEDIVRNRVMFGDPGFRIKKLYDQEEIREAWVQFQPTDTLNIKFGRQQVVWGETDIFQALDVIHGYDGSWAPLLEEADETRKPLILLNTSLALPAVGGGLQLVVRPGWDSERYIGASADIYGGRNRTSGFKGASTWYGNEMDYQHPEGKKNKPTYGLRWTQLLDNGVNYHLSYVKAHYTRNFIANSALAPWKKAPVDHGGVANFIFPIVEVYGAGANTYSQALDTVFSGEIAFTHGEPFNIGSVPKGIGTACVDAVFGPGAGTVPELSTLSGLCGVKRKNTVMLMARAEKTFDTMQTLGSSGPTMVSVQLFNTRVLGFKSSEGLVFSAGYPELLKRSATTGTLMVSTPWMNDKLRTTFAVVRDFSYRGTFGAVAVDYEVGPNWRLKAEWDFFRGRQSMTANQYGNAAGVPGMLDKNDRLVLRATYQF